VALVAHSIGQHIPNAARTGKFGVWAPERSGDLDISAAPNRREVLSMSLAKRPFGELEDIGTTRPVAGAFLQSRSTGAPSGKSCR